MLLALALTGVIPVFACFGTAPQELGRRCTEQGCHCRMVGVVLHLRFRVVSAKQAFSLEKIPGLM